MFSPDAFSLPPATNQTSISCLLPLSPSAFLPVLAFLPPCCSCGPVSTPIQGLKIHQSVTALALLQPHLSLHAAPVTAWPAVAQLCGTLLENASFSLAHPADLLLRLDSLFSLSCFFCSSSFLPSCHFGIISLSCKGKGGKIPKNKYSHERLTVLPLALCKTRHSSGRLPGT